MSPLTRRQGLSARPALSPHTLLNDSPRVSKGSYAQAGQRRNPELSVGPVPRPGVLRPRRRARYPLVYLALPRTPNHLVAHMNGRILVLLWPGFMALVLGIGLAGCAAGNSEQAKAAAAQAEAASIRAQQAASNAAVAAKQAAAKSDAAAREMNDAAARLERALAKLEKSNMEKQPSSAAASDPRAHEPPHL